jgi:hypothetical protein
MCLDRSRTARHLFAVIALLGPVVAAQVPDGWYVVSSVKNANASEDGRIFFVHPRQPSGVVAPIQVTGLPADLTGAGTSGVIQGANSVLYRPGDGALVVGEISTAVGQSVDLHLLTLSGNAVATSARFPLGTSPGPQTPQVAQSSFLPNGDILVGVSHLVAPGPLAGQHLGIVNPGTGAVAAVPVLGPPPGFVNAAIADPTGSQAWFGTFISTTSSAIYRVPLPGGGSPTFVASLPAGVSNLAFDDNGMLLASCLYGAGGPTLFLITPATGQVTPIPLVPPLGELNALAMERVTGNYVLVTGGGAPSPGTTYWAAPNGLTNQLTFFPLGWWGAKSGVDVNPDPETYGAGTPGANTYSWSLSPNPGGLPTVGNTSFSLSTRSTPGNAPGWFGLSLGRSSIPVGGITLLIDLPLLLLLFPIPAGPYTITLGIPAVPALSGLSFYGQTIHQEPGALAASDGVMVTIL